MLQCDEFPFDESYLEDAHIPIFIRDSSQVFIFAPQRPKVYYHPLACSQATLPADPLAGYRR